LTTFERKHFRERNEILGINLRFESIVAIHAKLKLTKETKEGNKETKNNHKKKWKKQFSTRETH